MLSILDISTKGQVLWTIFDHFGLLENSKNDLKSAKNPFLANLKIEILPAKISSCGEKKNYFKFFFFPNSQHIFAQTPTFYLI